MLVFIANATKQVLQFTYRLPERKAPITIRVPIGGQEKLAAAQGGYDLTQPDVDSVLEQWGKYGLIPVSELQSNRHVFQGYLFATHKPIRTEIIKDAIKIREQVVSTKGLEIRKMAAMEMVNTIERETKTPANQYEITVVEEEPREGYASNQTHIAEGYRVISSERPNMPEPPSRRGRRAA